MATVRYMRAEYLGQKNIHPIDDLPLMRHIVKLIDISRFSKDIPFKTRKGALLFAEWVSLSKLTYIFDRRKKDDSLNGKLRRAIIAIQFFEDYPAVESINRQLFKRLKEVNI